MITPDYVSFFKELESNNHKEWFHANKKRYEQVVKQPFYDLLNALISQLKHLEPEISGEAKDAVFRINRDIRFSKDKTPYNTLMKAGFAPGGRKSQWPGYYLGISAEKIHIGGGLFNLKGPELKQIRELIANKSDEFMGIVEKPSFVKRLGALKGEKAKRVDKHLQPALEKTQYIAHKQFYAMAEIPIEQGLNKGNLDKTILGYFEEVYPLNQFLKRGF
jgi:uncharacterized protein (TIGR02453 family)